MILTLCLSIVVIGVVNVGGDISNATYELESEERKEVCIKVLGCYPETDPNNAPTGNMDRLYAWFSEAIDTHFWQSTRESVGTEFRFWAPGSTQAEVMNNFNFHVHITKDSGYDATIKTFFIIHGYQGGNAPWAITMKDALMKKLPCNVFIVDWSEGDGLMYETALANTWVVGAETGRFIERIVELTGLKPRKIHIIGHSLGAHTAGFAGKWVKNRLKRKIGRITGLDPAGPDFDTVVPGERLHIDDAVFVDVIHTNWAESVMEGFGLQQPVGHFDFYPNGGEVQPGCPTAKEAAYNVMGAATGDDMTFADAFYGIACSHGRAYDFFIESIENDDCQFMAVECDSWEWYVAGRCPPGTGMRVPMGYRARNFRREVDNDLHKMFFLRTNPKPPYCIQ